MYERNQLSPNHHEAVKFFLKTTEDAGDALNIQFPWKIEKRKKENRKTWMKKLISIPWAHWTQGVILPDKDLHSEAFLLNKIEIHPYVKRLTETFFSFFVCKHNMSLVFQRAQKKKKRVTAETPNSAFQDEIMEILCVSKLLKLEAMLLKRDR